MEQEWCLWNSKEIQQLFAMSSMDCCLTVEVSNMKSVCCFLVVWGFVCVLAPEDTEVTANPSVLYLQHRTPTIFLSTLLMWYLCQHHVPHAKTINSLLLHFWSWTAVGHTSVSPVWPLIYFLFRFLPFLQLAASCRGTVWSLGCYWVFSTAKTYSVLAHSIIAVANCLSLLSSPWGFCWWGLSSILWVGHSTFLVSFFAFFF